MAYKPHRTRVRFEDNIHFVPATSHNSTYQGPRFPNLQAMFKQNINQNYDTGEETTQVTAPVHAEDKTTSKPNPTETINTSKKDVNTEVSEFIKRRHESLELQKLLSMKANT